MQTFTTIVAIVAVIGVIWGLIKRYETRLVLIYRRPRHGIPVL